MITELEGKASRKIEQILLSKSEQPEIHIKEVVKQKTEHLTEIKLFLDQEALQKLNRLKEILSHKIPNASYAQVVSYLAKLGLEKSDPELKAKRAENRRLKKERAANPSDLDPKLISLKKNAINMDKKMILKQNSELSALGS